MYSFYGGQKGQDFRISRIFSNRSEDLLQDLQARWYSPVNVGDYVLISYGDIAELNKIIKNQQGRTIEVESTYNRNLNIDLLNCGKSYTNSIWQKVYIEDKKNISPDFPNSEENTFIFINFEESPIIEEKDEDGNIFKYILDKEGIRRKCDDEGNWINELGQIIRFKQVPGYSLLETSDIYSEENYGFGYRLIACVTGQTPRIQVFHQTINIEDGDPYVTYNLTNPDRPEIKFYLQKSQRIQDIYTTVIAPTINPKVKLLTNENEYRIINGEKTYASLTQPIIDFQIPRAIRYYSGLLFGKGLLVQSPYIYSTDEEYDFNSVKYKVSFEECELISTISSIVGTTLERVISNDISEVNSDMDTTNKYEEENTSIINFEKFYQILEEEFSRVNEKVRAYYLKENSLNNLLNNVNVAEKDIPWGSYGLNKNESKNFESLYDYCTFIRTHLNEIQREISLFLNNNSYNMNLSQYWNKFGFISEEEYNLLDNLERVNYLSSYINGFYKENDLYIIANLFKFYTPIINIYDAILDINNENLNSYLLSEDNLSYIIKILEQLSSLAYHFSIVYEQYESGDIYINTPSGKLYQFIKSSQEQVLMARYIGILAAPAPEVDSSNTTAFIEKEKKLVYNQPSVKTNLLFKNNNLNYREKYLFDLPNQPILEPSIESVANREDASVTSEIKDLDTLLFKFKMPDAVKFFTYQDLDRFDYKNIEPVLKSGLTLKLNDIYIHTTSDIKDDYRGWIFMYKKNGSNYIWEKQGSILGPIGIPEPINTIVLKAAYDQPQGTFIQSKTGWKKDRIYREASYNIYTTVTIDSSYGCSEEKFASGEIFLNGSIIAPNEENAENLLLTYGVDYTYSNNKITFKNNIEGSSFQLYLCQNSVGQDIENTYWVNVDETTTSLVELIDKIAKEAFADKPEEYPDSTKGKITLIKIYKGLSKIDDQQDQLKAGDNYWGQYNFEQKKWYLTLITSQGSYMSDVKIDSPQQASQMTYTANYINNIAPTWDTDTYY